MVYSRFLFVVPLLVLAQMMVERAWGGKPGTFLNRELFPNTMQPGRGSQARRAANERLGGGGRTVRRPGLGCVDRGQSGFTGWLGRATWERSGTSTTWAGWWYALISLPILFFLLFRWLWVFVLWASFLFRVSQIDL